ncbi:hypothetical protein GF376_04540 [Candidatus Peregrinibacteria bacterium]|nr:hypothetical protein [Candidatus Peregrinibacteria bacterium]
MALSYSLNFKKFNLQGRLVLEKEGEVVFNRNHFRLKGKGANDHGEVIHFTDIKEIRIEKDLMIFVTFSKDKWILSKFGTSFEQFLEDFYKLKNEFFVDNLFMKMGMLAGEFDCHAEMINQFGKVINKGVSSIQFYEQSIVIIPKLADAFVIYLNFLKHHEFNEESYELKLENDAGVKVIISKLGSHFEEAESIMDMNLEKMYQKILSNLNLVFNGFPIQTLLKLAYMIRNGRCVSLQSLKKLDPSLAQKILEVSFEGNNELEQKIQFLRSMDDENELYLGMTFENNGSAYDVNIKAWYLCALPNLNTIVIGKSNNPDENKSFFFRIVMEQGDPKEKLPGKVLEVNQCMVLFDYDLSPIHKDKNELRKSKYRVALLRLAFLRLFRRSFLGYTDATNMETFKNKADRFFTQAKVLHKPVLRHRQIFKSTLK